MKSYTTKKEKVVQVSVFVLPGEKKIIEKEADEQDRSVSNFCKRIIMKEVKS